GEDTAENLIAELQPDIYVKGGDYTLETLPEAKIVQAYGGQIELVQLVEGKSTTKIIEKISG
ncbi:MAG: D-glycero-beta-D-manno-heptose 1-phosphate adenylyltransferase, partial [Selenomonadaceae bacterium]|nr:D-glycero-beta-D-manno-heptose 1-phosphate adenylyltransferase [Selenomonadaceae bacterium]